jgi:hypothetical protein
VRVAVCTAANRVDRSMHGYSAVDADRPEPQHPAEPESLCLGLQRKLPRGSQDKPKWHWLRGAPYTHTRAREASDNHGSRNCQWR